MSHFLLWKFLGLYEVHVLEEPTIKPSKAREYLSLVQTAIPVLAFVVMTAETISDFVKARVKNPGLFIGMSLNLTCLLLVASVTMLVSAVNHRKTRDLNIKVQKVEKLINSHNRRIRIRRSLLCLWIAAIVLVIFCESALEKSNSIVKNLLLVHIQLIKLYITVRNLEVVGKIVEALKVLNGIISSMRNEILQHQCKEGERKLSLRTVGGVHWLISEAIQEISKVHGVVLCVQVLSQFVLITTASYGAYSCYQTHSPAPPPLLSYCLVISKLACTVLQVIELIVLIVPCAAASQEANKTLTIICQLLNMDLPSGLRKKLSTLALQLPHHNTTFSACGMFNLDLSVISTVTAAVATYLIMIIQFQDAKVINKAIVNNNN